MQQPRRFGRRTFIADLGKGVTALAVIGAVARPAVGRAQSPSPVAPGGSPLAPPVPQPSAFPAAVAAASPQPKAAPTPQAVPAYMQQQPPQQQQVLQPEPAAEPARPRERTERERMAAALFGGLGASAGAGSHHIFGTLGP